MTQLIERKKFATVAVDDLSYQIFLTSPERDYIQSALATKGIPYELEMLRDMQSRLSKDSTVLDIGANIGNHSFFLCNIVGCYVIAFEANDDLAHAMNITSSEAGLDEKIIIHSFALGEKAGFARFANNVPDNLGSQSLSLDEGEIKVRTLDSCGISVNVDAVKIDVEGMELDVLKGGVRLLEKNQPMLYVECQSKDNFRDISAFLRNLGYQYVDTFNATPTHLFIHQTKGNNEENVSNKTQLKLVEREYDLLAIANKYKKKLDDLQLAYAEVSRSNAELEEHVAALNDTLNNVRNTTSENSNTVQDLQLDTERLQKRVSQLTQENERITNELAMQREENAAQIHNLKQRAVKQRVDAELYEKLTLEVERLTSENRIQKTLLEGQQDLKLELDSTRRTSIELNLVLETYKAECDQLRSGQKLLNEQLANQHEELLKFEQLRQTLSESLKSEGILKNNLAEQTLGVQELEQTLERQSFELEGLREKLSELANWTQKAETLEIEIEEKNRRLAQLSVEHEARVDEIKLEKKEQEERIEQQVAELAELREKLSELANLERKVEALETEIDEGEKRFTQLVGEHDAQIHEIKSLYQQHLQDNEQHLQVLIEKKLESLGPLQANQEKLNQLAEYMIDLEKIYSERTPLLDDIAVSSIESLRQKKAELKELNKAVTNNSYSR